MRATLADLSSRIMAEAKPKKWMQRAVKPGHAGKFTAKAERAGKPVHEFAEEKKDAAGTLGKEARLALTFEGAAAKRKKLYSHPRSRRA